jgi:hypothetical protein
MTQLLSLADLVSAETWKSRDIWIAGKGPSLRFHAGFVPDDALVLAINHACTVLRCDFAIFTDVEALEDCAKFLESARNVKVLLPNTPHLRNAPRSIDVERLRQRYPVLERLCIENRLFVFQTSNTRQRRGLGPVIELRYFSVEAAYQVACHMGATKISTIGVDGGSSYHWELDDTAHRRRLSNGRSSFDAQFRQLAVLNKRFGVPMTDGVPSYKVFVGVAERELVAFKVLEYSIKKHASVPVSVVPLPPVTRIPRSRANRARTPFSFSRYLIPELMNFNGVAVYMDSDMVVFSDVAELFSTPLDGSSVAVTSQVAVPEKWTNDPHFRTGRQYSLMVIDCERARWHIDEVIGHLDSGEFRYEDLLYDLAIEPSTNVRGDLDARWNHLESFVAGETKLLHFTVVPTQPWKDPSQPLWSVWEQLFLEACERGYVSLELVEKSVRRGHVDRRLLDVADSIFARVGEHSRSEVKGHPVLIEGGAIADTWFRILAAVRNTKWRLGRAVRGTRIRARETPGKSQDDF